MTSDPSEPGTPGNDDDRYDETEDGRYWTLWSPNEANKLDEISNAANQKLCGIVDEKTGVTVAYANEDIADSLVSVLNMADILNNAILKEND